MKQILLIIVIGISFGLNAQNWNLSGDNVSTGSLTIGSTAANSVSKIIVRGPNQPLYGGSKRDLSFEFSSAGSAVLRAYRGGSWDTYMQFLTTPSSGGTALTRMHINGNGNIGIGTTNPIYAKLQIRGGTTHKLFAINRPNNDVPALYLGNDGTNNAAIASNNSDLTFGKDLSGNYTEYMRIKNGGNVGIGTTDTKGFKLGVNGKIAATEVKVATYVNWPDYVFKDAYNLPPLKEVERHIKEKGYLKDIPSAEEVKENGIFLGDMNAKLLQKIEELTLYTIEQEKRMDALELKNNELVTLLEKLVKSLEK